MKNNINVANYEELLKSYQSYLSSKSLTDSLANFEGFLTENELSTTHADEVYNTLNKSTSLLHKLFTKKEITTRNKHHKAKSVVKWVGPTIALSVAITVAGALGLAATTATVGSSFLGLTMQANAFANALKVGVTGFTLIGLPAGMLTTVATKIVSKSHLNKEYGNVKEAIENDNLDSLKIDQLIADISAEKEEILNSKLEKGNFFKRIGKGISRFAKNVSNRIKTHKLEEIHNELAKKLVELSNSDLNEADKKLAFQKYEKVLNKINDFSVEQFKKSRVFLLLTCDDSSKGHKHQEILENEDILAEMQRTAEKLTKAINSTDSIKTVAKNYNEAQEVAIEMLNEEFADKGTTNLIKKCAEKLVPTVKPAPPTPPKKVTVSSFVVSGNILTVNYSDGKSVNFNLTRNDVTNVVLNDRGTHIEITYSDSTTQKFPKNGEKLPDLKVTGAINILDNLKDLTFRATIIAKGNDATNVDNFERDLSALIYTAKTKKVKAHARVFNSAEYNANPSYRKIVDDCNDLIKTSSVGVVI